MTHRPRINKSLTQQKIDPALWMILIYLGLLIGLYLLAPKLIVPLAFGWYLSLIIDVPARFFFRIRILTYKWAVVISSLLIYGLLLLAMFSLVPIALEQAQNVTGFLSNYVVEFQEPVFLQKWGFSRDVLSMVESSAGSIVKMATDVSMSVLNLIIQNLPSLLTGSVIFLITASYFTTVTPVLKKNLWRFFPRSTHKKTYKFWGDFYKDIQHFVGGQMLIALCTGVLVGLGMLIMEVPYPLFLGFLAGITNFIPYLGSIITMIPATLLGFT
ncbi:MAG: AI-2E family transporter, partial [Spirochaetaceae bacterium]|nr:AI-2E family transporter [Spirochaetaceae bacterium]